MSPSRPYPDTRQFPYAPSTPAAQIPKKLAPIYGISAPVAEASEVPPSLDDGIINDTTSSDTLVDVEMGGGVPR